jgi:hypothetical protein
MDVDVDVQHEGIGKEHSERIAVRERGHRDVVLELFLRFASSHHTRTISTPSFSNAFLHQRCSHGDLRSRIKHSLRHYHPRGHKKRSISNALSAG